MVGEEAEGEHLLSGCWWGYPAGLTFFWVASAGPVFFGYKSYLFEDALESFILCLYLCSSEYLSPSYKLFGGVRKLSET